jgi:hypothetical protein
MIATFILAGTTPEVLPGRQRAVTQNRQFRLFR